MIKAVLFDLDGVLAFTEDFYNRRRLDFLRERGLKVDLDFDGTGSSDEEIWKELVPGDSRLRALLHGEYRLYSDSHPTPWERVVNPQARETLSELKASGVKVAICSSSYRLLIEEFSRALGISELLDLIISGEECAAYKPDPEIYLRAMGALGVSAQQVLVVEDSPLGIEAGVCSGALTCALVSPRGNVLDQSGADLRIGQLHDIINLVNG